MKLLISASLLSAMVFYSSLLPFLHSFNLYISATAHKNYMFLLCNGLLVFIVRNSGLISCSGDRHSSGDSRGAEALEASMADGSSKIESKVEDREERGNGLIQKDEESERSIMEDDDDDDEEEVGALSKEELNKKCEEFIRKMKAGIKLESQQLLVL
ncbi:hypothetical protein SDJN02_16544, partial [Cucurbita argyrosperma subsp. argyrosperma]